MPSLEDVICSSADFKEAYTGSLPCVYELIFLETFFSCLPGTSGTYRPTYYMVDDI